MTDNATSWSKNPKVLAREVAGETVLFNMDTAHYLVLNEVGTFIWGLIASSTHGEIVRQLVGRYEVSRDVAEEALRKFVGELTEEGILDFEETA